MPTTMRKPSPLTRGRVTRTVLATAFLAAPTTVALAADDDGLQYIHYGVPAGRIVEDGLADHARATLTDRAVTLGRRVAKLRDRRFDARGYRAELDGRSIKQLQRRIARERRSIRTLERTGGAPKVAIPAALAGIAACESGGNPRAIGGGGAYRGKYQFDRGTWASVGGSGDPAAAPEVEQDRRAAMLYARAGAAPWPVCGR